MRNNHARRDGITLILFGMIIGITLMLAMVVIGHQSSAQGAEKVHRPPLPVWMRTPCANDGDSVNCFWNATEQGNGTGHSFYVRRFPGKVGHTCVMYTERSYQRFDYCMNQRPHHHRAQPHRTRHLCRTAESVNCYHKRESREFPTFYAMRVYLTDTHGNDDLGSVICHFYIRSQTHDTCEAQDLFGS